MKPPKNIQLLANEIGAEIEIFPEEHGWHIEALAPDGMEWVASGGVSLVCRIFTNCEDPSKDKKEAFEDLYERMKQGVSAGVD